MKERIEGRDSTQVTLNDLDDKCFTVMVWAKLLLDVAHVRDNVQELLEIFAYPNIFVPRFHGNMLTYTRSLDAGLAVFEGRNGRNGPITRKLVSQLLTLQVLNDSMEVSISGQRTPGLHQRIPQHSGETFAKMPAERDEWPQICGWYDIYSGGSLCLFGRIQ